MSSWNARALSLTRAGRALGLWIYLLVVLVGAAVALLLSVRSAPVVADDPWLHLLEGNPTLSDCRQFAERFPELFDSLQPVQDPTLLVTTPGRDEVEWQRKLERYEAVVMSEDIDGADPEAAALRLDYLGRKQVAQAWAEVADLKDSLERVFGGVLKPDDLRAFLAHDLPAARRAILHSQDHFADLEHWAGLLVRMDEAAKTEAGGLGKLEKALEAAPLFVPAQLTLAYIEIAHGDPGAAEARCRQLLAALDDDTPARIRVRYCLARALELNGRCSSATQQIRQILKREPHNFQAKLRLGALYLKLDRTDEANSIADELLKGNQRDPRPSYIKGVASLRRGDYEEAVTHLNTALQVYPYDINVHYCLARAEEGTGRHVSASAQFVRVAASTTEAGWPLAAAAACALGDRGRAKEVSEAADLVLKRKDWTAATPKLHHYALRFKIAGNAMLGDDPGAALAADQLARLARDRQRSPRPAERRLANYLIAGVWASQAYVSAGSRIRIDNKHLDFFRQAPPGEPSAKVCLAFLLAVQGQREDARRLLEELVRVAPDYTLAALFLARLYVIEGKTERAARTLERDALAASPEVRKALALIRSLQGLKVPDESYLDPEAPAPDPVVGPHLALFGIIVHDDSRAYAQRVVLLDPVADFGYDILRLAYPHVREHGVAGVTTAAQADESVDLAIRRGAAQHRAAHDGLHRLVIGRFWDDVPPHL